MAAGILAPVAAEAAYVTGNVNLRTGPSTSYSSITTIPAGSRVSVSGCSSWCSVNYRGIRGYVSASYVSGGAMGPGPMRPPPPMMHRPPPPTWGYYQKPRWDSRHNAWYDGRRWYFGGKWYDKPSGFSFGFGISGR
ncbi:MAG: SH3 domain-containing protein [Rhizobiales bacterium]|nr:SH3 domain-containing protein [Hyphomicrobiales bacterium]